MFCSIGNMVIVGCFLMMLSDISASLEETPSPFTVKSLNCGLWVRRCIGILKKTQVKKENQIQMYVQS